MGDAIVVRPGAYCVRRSQQNGAILICRSRQSCDGVRERMSTVGPASPGALTDHGHACGLWSEDAPLVCPDSQKCGRIHRVFVHNPSCGCLTSGRVRVYYPAFSCSSSNCHRHAFRASSIVSPVACCIRTIFTSREQKGSRYGSKTVQGLSL